MNLAIISTSPRSGSNSLKVARYFRRLGEASGNVTITLTDFEDADIPLVGRGALDPEKLTAFQEKLVTSWKNADLVLFIVPEYNWITGGELINAFHQLGSKHFTSLFNDKVFAFAGVSNGKGGRRPGIEMTTLVNKIISVLSGKSIVAPKIFESQYTQNVLDAEGESKGDASYEKAAKDFLAYNLAVAERWCKKGS
jgi:chromate reductase